MREVDLLMWLQVAGGLLLLIIAFCRIVGLDDSHRLLIRLTYVAICAGAGWTAWAAVSPERWSHWPALAITYGSALLLWATRERWPGGRPPTDLEARR